MVFISIRLISLLAERREGKRGKTSLIAVQSSAICRNGSLLFDYLLSKVPLMPSKGKIGLAR